MTVAVKCPERHVSVGAAPLRGGRALLVCVLVLLVGAQHVRGDPPTAGLITHWTFDNTLADSSGNGNTGTVSNNLVFTFDRHGHPFGAIRFDGGSTLTVPQTFPFNAGQSAEVSVSFWLRPTGAGHRSIFYSRTDGVDSNRYDFHTGSNLELALNYREPSGPVHSLVSTTTTEIEWVHFVVTRTSGHVYTLYKNNVQVHQVTDSNPDIPDTTGAWHVAGRSSGLQYVGDLDDVRFYNRVLTAGERTELYNEAGSPPANHLITHWKFDGSLVDSSPFGNTGTVIAGAVSYVEDHFGDEGRAAYFDGSTTLSIPQMFPFNFNGPNTVSVAFWMKEVFNGHRSIMWGRSDSADTDRFDIHTGGSGAAAEMNYREYCSGCTGPAHFMVVAPVTSGVWTHIAITRAGNLYTIYKNGVSTDTYTDSSPVLPRPTGSWELAGRYPSIRYVGALDDVRFYSKTLSPTEVQAIFNLATDNTCANGTVNDPLVALPTPTLNAPSFASNNYIFGLNVDKRYESVQASFPGSLCSFDSRSTLPAEWTVADSASEPVCTSTYTFSKNAQNTLASCGFGAPSTQGDYQVYTATLSVQTNQTRSVPHQQNLRNQTYTQLKTTHFTLSVSVPTRITVEHTGVSVTGNISVLQAITALNVNVPSSGPYTVGFTMLTSSQAPYQLAYNSFTAPASLGTSITPPSPNPAPCSGSGPAGCTQHHTFSDLQIVTPCPTKGNLNDALTVTFDVQCDSSFAGLCNPSPSQITVSFTLVSVDYCPTANEVTLSATLHTYRDVDINGVDAWDVGQRTTQYVIGSTVYGLMEVTVGEDAATTATTTLTSLQSEGVGGALVPLVTSGSPVATGVQVQNGDATIHFGGASNDNYKKQSRFAVPLEHGETVSLDVITDQAQAVKFVATLTVSFTVSKHHADAEHLLNTWATSSTGHSQEVQATSGAGSVGSVGFEMQTSRRRAYTSTAVSIGSAPAGVTPSTGQSTSSTGSTTLAVGVVVCVAVVVMVAAYLLGYRRGNDKDVTTGGELEHVDILANAAVGQQHQHELRSSSTGSELEPSV